MNTRSLQQPRLFLRTEATLPDRLRLRRRSITESWMSIDLDPENPLEAAVGAAGWHFILASAGSTRIGVGTNTLTAIHNALSAALGELKPRFNAAELISLSVRKYPGLHVAQATIQARHIQPSAFLGWNDDQDLLSQNLPTAQAS